jgi:hypothetical protein
LTGIQENISIYAFNNNKKGNPLAALLFPVL